MKKILVLMITTIALLWGCEENDTGNVKISVSNASEFDFQNVHVNPGSEEMNFGAIDAGDFSDYKTFTKAYRYGFIQLEINGDTVSLQPVDYVGETPLKNGFYTYKLDVSGSPGQFSLSLELEKDK